MNFSVNEFSVDCNVFVSKCDQEFSIFLLEISRKVISVMARAFTLSRGNAEWANDAKNVRQGIVCFN